MEVDVVAPEVKAEVLKNGGRFDQEKIKFELLEPYAIQQVAKVFTFGAQKYAANNWIENPMNISRLLGSLHRHINAFEQGEDVDPETGLSHMAHAAWNALAVVSYMKYHPHKDDRVVPKLNNEE